MQISIWTSHRTFFCWNVEARVKSKHRLSTPESPKVLAPKQRTRVKSPAQLFAVSDSTSFSALFHIPDNQSVSQHRPLLLQLTHSDDNKGICKHCTRNLRLHLQCLRKTQSLSAYPRFEGFSEFFVAPSHLDFAKGLGIPFAICEHVVVAVEKLPRTDLITIRKLSSLERRP